MQEYKKQRVKEIFTRLQDSKSIVLIDYKGINVDQVDNLRALFREANVDYFVSKNSFIKIALGNLKIDQLDNILVGPTAIAVSKTDEIDPARVLTKFKKEVLREQDFPSFKGGYVSEALLDSEQLSQLAKLPSRDELISKIMATMKAPITNFVFINKGILRSLVYAIKAIADSKK